MARQCELMGLSRASFYYEARSQSEQNLRYMRLIDEQYTRTPFYGVARMTQWLVRQGFVLNPKRVRRLMRLMGLEAIYPKPKTSVAASEHQVYPYLLRGVPIVRVNQVWSSDITYIRLRGGFLYLVAVMDWFSRFVLSWSVSNTLEGRFCREALEAALRLGRPEIFNSDQGSQFTSKDFTEQVKASGAQISMDGCGRALDNAFVERLWRSVKYEEVYLKDYGSAREAITGLGQYFVFYNGERLHQSLGYRTPATVYMGQ